jgi:hypothetical protein
MRSRYRAKSGKLNDLLSEVVHFFLAKGFKVSTDKKGPQTIISVKTSESASTPAVVRVSLAGDTDGSLLVTFESFDASPLVRNSNIPSMLGGGFLTLKSLKISEIIEGLEREFWGAVDRFMVSS